MVRKKCPYCDFNSHPIKGDVDQEAYRLALEADWAAQSQTSDVFASVFFGGGTPSLFHPKYIGRLLDKLPSRRMPRSRWKLIPVLRSTWNFRNTAQPG